MNASGKPFYTQIISMTAHHPYTIPQKKRLIDLPDRFDGTPATRWTFRITSSESGCVVAQQFEHLPDGLSGLRLQAEHVDDAEALIAWRRTMLGDGMTQTLEHIRRVLQS